MDMVTTAAICGAIGTSGFVGAVLFVAFILGYIVIGWI